MRLTIHSCYETDIQQQQLQHIRSSKTVHNHSTKPNANAIKPNCQLSASYLATTNPTLPTNNIQYPTRVYGSLRTPELWERESQEVMRMSDDGCDPHACGPDDAISSPSAHAKPPFDDRLRSSSGLSVETRDIDSSTSLSLAFPSHHLSYFCFCSALLSLPSAL